MSTKTFFKRVSLGLVFALSFGLLSGPSSQATVLTSSITLSSATASASVGDTATVTATIRFTGNASDNTATGAGQMNTDSVVMRYSCDAPSGATCPTLGAYQDAASDTANIMTKNTGTWRNMAGGTVGDSLTSTLATGRSPYLISTNSPHGSAFTTAGTYTYNFYLTRNADTASVVTLSSGSTTVTWTVTVTAPAKDAVGGSARVFISSDSATASITRANWLFGASSSDSAITAVRGSASTPAPVGFGFLRLLNSSGDTRIALGSGFTPVQDSVVVTVNGPGLIGVGDLNGTQTAPAKAATMSVSNSRDTSYKTETLTIYNDGTAGTMTITFSKGSTTLATSTVRFTGPAASVVTNLSDSYTALRTAGTSTVTLAGQVKDSAANVLNTGTLYVFSSDTAIAGSVPTTAVFGQTGHRCSTFTGTSASTFSLSCSIILRDTGTVTLTVGDSWTVAASSFTSTAVSLTITGNVVGSATVAFNKATYAPGERAVITITTKDISGNLSANGATGTLARAPLSNYTLTGVTTSGISGTAGSSDNTYSSTLTRVTNADDGVETRVVTMPSFGGDITYTISVPNPLNTALYTDVTATAKVVDPNATAIATAGAAATAAADAATDAALEAIDAANAATDAANLAAEAADAATVAAEEARDAADAATAAVEALATEVATLMAALKAQITTLANTVAKIAKKIKA